MQAPDRVERGEFMRGMLHGKGKMKFPNGTIAEGEFEGYLLNGKGKIAHANGRVEEGIFKNGVLIQI